MTHEELMKVEADKATVELCIHVLEGNLGAGRGAEALDQRNDDISILKTLIENKDETVASLAVKNKIRALIIDIVNENAGITSVELVTQVINQRYLDGEGYPEHRNEEEDLEVEMVNRLVQQGDIVEVEYVTPRMDYRVKSMYFPKGTLVTCVKPKR